MISLITIRRGLSTILSNIPIGDDTVMLKELMGMDKIETSFILNQPTPILVDDYIEYNSSTYKVKEAPDVEKIDSKTFVYNVTFYGETYDLYDKLIMDEGRTRFSYTGTPNDLLQLILTNMQELDASWALGGVSLISEVITFNFNEQSCRNALTQVAEAFGLEYYIEGKEIYLIDQVGTAQTHRFEYGRGKGLYSLQRKSVDEPFATRIYGFGAAQNVPSTYRDGLGRLTFEEKYIEKNVSIYGRKEGSVIFNDIFPRFEGVVFTSPEINSVIDGNIDFDLNDLIITEGAAKIVFKTGDLAGNEFPITSFEYGVNKVTFGQTEDENGYILPNATVRPKVNDTFTFVGIAMPQSYIDNAEAELKTKVDEYADNNSSPKVSYDLDIDEKYVRLKGLEDGLFPGDSIQIIDRQLGVDESIRIQQVEYPLVNPGKVKAVVSDVRQYTEKERIVKDVKETKRELDQRIASVVFARQLADEIRNYAVIEQFKKTKVGERAVMSGVFVAGNPDDGDVAGINGSGSGDDEVRIWAGKSFDDRGTAPFRVYNNGVFYFFKANSLNGDAVLIEDIGLGSNGIEYDGSNLLGGVNTYQGVNRGGNAISFIKGSLFGGIENGEGGIGGEAYPDPSSNFEIRAGVVGMVVGHWLENDTGNIALWDYVQKQLDNCRGFYGGLFSSLKNTGPNHESLIITSSDTLLDRYHNVVISGGGSTKNLPQRPDHGFTITIVNRTAGTKTISAATFDSINRKSGSSVGSMSLAAGETLTLKYDGAGRDWYEF